MFIQTETTPNPNSLKFIPGRIVSNSGQIEVTKKDQINNDLVKNLLSINGVTGVFLSKNFLSINKEQNVEWEDIKHIAQSLIGEFYLEGKEFIYDTKDKLENNKEFKEIEKKIIKLLDTKIRPAVARDGGDIQFIDYENGTVRVKLKGSCSGCPSSTMTLKQGVQNLLKHYIPEVKDVEAIQ
tara:strand:+ start:2548 stop:3093 length:546 start_codon:yes stop_codon:yes gene_type:complete